MKTLKQQEKDNLSDAADRAVKNGEPFIERMIMSNLEDSLRTAKSRARLAEAARDEVIQQNKFLTAIPGDFRKYILEDIKHRYGKSISDEFVKTARQVIYELTDQMLVENNVVCHLSYEDSPIAVEYRTSIVRPIQINYMHHFSRCDTRVR